MRVLGFRCKKDSFSWALLEGSSRSTAVIVDRNVVTAPHDTREKQLAWVSAEVLSLLEQCNPDCAAIQAPGGAQGGLTDSLVQRIEVDGVVRSVLGVNSVPTQSVKPQSMSTALGVKKVETDRYLETIPCVLAVPKTHREPVVLAVARLPE